MQARASNLLAVQPVEFATTGAMGFAVTSALSTPLDKQPFLQVAAGIAASADALASNKVCVRTSAAESRFVLLHYESRPDSLAETLAGGAALVGGLLAALNGAVFVALWCLFRKRARHLRLPNYVVAAVDAYLQSVNTKPGPGKATNPLPEPTSDCEKSQNSQHSRRSSESEG